MTFWNSCKLRRTYGFKWEPVHNRLKSLLFGCAWDRRNVIQAMYLEIQLFQILWLIKPFSVPLFTINWHLLTLTKYFLSWYPLVIHSKFKPQIFSVCIQAYFMKAMCTQHRSQQFAFCLHYLEGQVVLFCIMNKTYMWHKYMQDILAEHQENWTKYQ